MPDSPGTPPLSRELERATGWLAQGPGPWNGHTIHVRCFAEPRSRRSPPADGIVFHSNRGGRAGDLYQKAASGSDQDELLVSTPNDKTVNQWFRNGQFIVYSENDPKTKWDLWVFPVGDRKPIRFLNSDFNELQGQMSPDGRWMAYTSDESGQREVYVRPFPA